MSKRGSQNAVKFAGRSWGLQKPKKEKKKKSNKKPAFLRAKRKKRLNAPTPKKVSTASKESLTKIRTRKTTLKDLLPEKLVETLKSLEYKKEND
jgi:hypothetical protein